MSREKMKYPRKLANFRLMPSQLNDLERASQVLGKSKTALVEEAIARYLNQLRINQVI